MTAVAAIPVSKIEAGATSGDGKVFAIKVAQPNGTELTLELPTSELMALVDMAAVGHTQSRKLQHVNPNWKEFFKSTWFELSQDKATGLIILSLTFGAGGTLSFSLPDHMPEQIVETLQTLMGKSIPSPMPRGTRLS
jgi:hypothetical protein